MKLFEFSKGGVEIGIPFHGPKGREYIEMGSNSHLNGETFQSLRVPFDKKYPPSVDGGRILDGWIRWVQPQFGGDPFPVISRPVPVHRPRSENRGIVLINSMGTLHEHEEGLVFSSPPESEVLLSATTVALRLGKVIKAEHSLVFMARKHDTENGKVSRVEILDTDGNGHRVVLSEDSIESKRIEDFQLLERDEKKVIKITF